MMDTTHGSKYPTDDNDGEDLRLQDMLTEVAFKEDHNKRLRLQYLQAAKLCDMGVIAAPGSGKWKKNTEEPKQYKYQDQGWYQYQA